MGPLVFLDDPGVSQTFAHFSNVILGISPETQNAFTHW